ncbi:MAG: TonB-dependent siderophore receptor [Phenylobacterium sp.]
MTTSRRIALLAAASSLCLAGAAHAQDTEVGEVLVTATRATTATKTDTALIETPQAISVVTAAQVADRGAQTMQEALRYTAGVVSEAYGLDTRQDQPVVRGFYATQYRDGMRTLFGYSLIPRAEVFTLERTELLRGPSSVLYGQGSTGGVVNMVSKRPQTEAGGEVAVQIGSYDRKQFQIDVTGPLGSDALSGRIVALARDAGMQTREIPDDRFVFAPSLTWRPTDATSFTLLGLYQQDKTASSQQFLPVVATLQAPPGRRMDDRTFLGEPGFDKLDTDQAGLTLLAEHSFTPGLKFTSGLRYVEASAAFNEIYPNVYANPTDPFVDAAKRRVGRSAYAIESDTSTFTTDNNLAWDVATGPLSHKLLVGIDYLNYREKQKTGFGAVADIDIYAPVYGNFIAPTLSDLPTLKQNQVGVYLQDPIRFADRVSVVLGARRDRAESQVGSAEAQVDYATTWRAGVIVDVGFGLSPYVSYTESFLPVAGLDFYGDAFKPQQGEQYEAGIKWQPNARTLVTLTGYKITETNRPTNDPNNVLNTVQTGEVESKGVEIEAATSVTDSFYVTASYSYTEAEVTQSSFAPEVGVQLADTPKDLASAWGVKTWRLTDEASLRTGLGVRYVGSTLSTGVAGSLKTPSYTLADALVALDWRDWSLSVNATNLFDKSYYAPCRTFGDCFTGNRRNVVATLGYRF